MSMIELTEEQRHNVIADMNEKIEMLTDAEIEHLVTQLNEKVNIAFLRESSEQTVLVKLVKKVDRYLYDALPNELYGLVQDATDGASDEEAPRVEKRLHGDVFHPIKALRWLEAHAQTATGRA